MKMVKTMQRRHSGTVATWASDVRKDATSKAMTYITHTFEFDHIQVTGMISTVKSCEDDTHGLILNVF